MTKIVLDSHQKEVQNALKHLAKALESRTKNSMFSRFFTTKHEPISSLYIYGGVGRGKSMLMGEFFQSLTIAKQYFHFNHFMRLIHEALRDVRQESKYYPDELIEATKRTIQTKQGTTKVICFDEFQVTDIADAMLLSRIFTYVFSQNIVVIFTSNTKPQDLYQNGLQREIFLEFVHHVLIKHCQVLQLDSPTDYRSHYTQNLTKRFFIEGQDPANAVPDIMDHLIDKTALKPTTLKVWGRHITINQTYNQKIAIISFHELCAQNHSASDYQAICAQFHLIFLTNLPKLTPQDVNEARRFILFIDEVYENKTALIVQSQINIDEIYVEGTGHQAFKRTVSRLKEIKSDAYWKASKINF